MVFTTALRREALSITNEFPDGFDAYLGLLERFEPKRMSRYTEIVRKMFGGLNFKANIDEHFRQYEELNDQLEQFESKMSDRYLIVCITNSLPDKYINAKTAIGLKEDCSLAEAKSIIKSVKDSLQSPNTYRGGGRTYRAVAAAPPSQKNSFGGQRRGQRPTQRANQPRKDRSDLMCFRCGEKGHFASKCSNISADYKCSHCGRNHLEKLCRNKIRNAERDSGAAMNVVNDQEQNQLGRIYSPEDRRWRDPSQVCMTVRSPRPIQLV